MFYLIPVILFFAVFPYLVMILKYPKDMRDSLKWLIKSGGKFLPYSTTKDSGAGKGFIYCPHPFTNWSLNPSYQNPSGEPNHTIEGFRKTSDADSIVKLVKENPASLKIVCAGSSTTYCNFVERYQDAWPTLLKEKLRRDDLLVFNFGIGAWTTLQSVIRCLTWLPIVRPKLLIFYQAKNDFVALVNGARKEKSIFPDYQNVMGQFSESFYLKFPRWLLYVPFFSLMEMRRLNRDLFFNLYKKPKPWQSNKGFERLSEDLINGVLFRIESLINMCNMIGCKLLYIPEIVREGPYVPILEKVYKRAAEVIHKYDNAFFSDLRKSIPDSDEYFLSRMHLSKKGCERFAEAVAEEAEKII